MHHIFKKLQKVLDKCVRSGYNTTRNTANWPGIYADMAQVAEHVLGKDEVTGSNPVISSKKRSTHLR